MKGAYTWSNANVKKKADLSAGAFTRGGGLMGGEIRYGNAFTSGVKQSNNNRRLHYGGSEVG